MSSLLGPFAYTTVLSLTGRNHRLAMSTILLFFVVGLFILFFVREREGTQLAERLNEDFRTANQTASVE
jgi:MFS-type transporter involved in bile tolerance (Atg22 family)